MGQEAPQPNQPPPKTTREMVKEYSKEIDQSKREFEREKYKIELVGKRMQKDLQTKIKKNENKAAQKQVAQQILKNQQQQARFQKIIDQMNNMKMELQQMSANEQIQNMMGKMANIMGSVNSKNKNKDLQQTMKRYMTEKERMQIMNEMTQDILEGDDEEIEDEDVDHLINDLTQQEVARKQKKQQLELDQYEEDLNDL